MSRGERIAWADRYLRDRVENQADLERVAYPERIDLPNGDVQFTFWQVDRRVRFPDTVLENYYLDEGSESQFRARFNEKWESWQRAYEAQTHPPVRGRRWPGRRP
ncbi:MAG: hypothetical protein ACRD2G_00245, partial [Terriglobia bacterium]